MKKITLLILTAILIVVLAACSDNNDKKDETQTKSITSAQPTTAKPAASDKGSEAEKQAISQAPVKASEPSPAAIVGELQTCFDGTAVKKYQKKTINIPLALTCQSEPIVSEENWQVLLSAYTLSETEKKLEASEVSLFMKVEDLSKINIPENGDIIWANVDAIIIPSDDDDYNWAFELNETVEFKTEPALFDEALIWQEKLKKGIAHVTLASEDYWAEHDNEYPADIDELEEYWPWPDCGIIYELAIDDRNPEKQVFTVKVKSADEKYFMTYDSDNGFATDENGNQLQVVK